MSEHSVRGHNRFDFQIEVVDFNPETGLVEYHVHPDPGRYEWREQNGKRVLYDRFDDVYFPHALVMQMLRRALRMKPGPALGVIPDVAAYVASRRPLIAAALRGKGVGGPLVDLSEAQLHEFETDELAFVILSVDIQGSTRLQTSTDRQTFAATITALLTEIAELVALFHGHVLKYTGDGLIAYFAPPTFIIKNDAAVDCAYCVRRLVYDAINPELEAAGLSTIDVRLGLDGGEAAIVVLGSDKTKMRRRKDLELEWACRTSNKERHTLPLTLFRVPRTLRKTDRHRPGSWGRWSERQRRGTERLHNKALWRPLGPMPNADPERDNHGHPVLTGSKTRAQRGSGAFRRRSAPPR